MTDFTDPGSKHNLIIDTYCGGTTETEPIESRPADLSCWTNEKNVGKGPKNPLLEVK